MSCILEELIMAYRVVGSTMGNQGSTGYLIIQLSVVRVMPGLRHHTSCLFVWGYGFQLLEPCSLSWFSAKGVKPWYRASTVPFQNTCTTLTDNYNNDYIVWYVRKWLWYGTQLNTILVKLIIINRLETYVRLHTSLSSVVFFYRDMSYISFITVFMILVI